MPREGGLGEKSISCPTSEETPKAPKKKGDKDRSGVGSKNMSEMTSRAIGKMEQNCLLTQLDDEKKGREGKHTRTSGNTFHNQDEKGGGKGEKQSLTYHRKMPLPKVRKAGKE